MSLILRIRDAHFLSAYTYPPPPPPKKKRNDDMLKMQLGFLARLRPVAPYLQPRAHLHGSMASSLSASVPFDRAMPRLLPTPLTMPRLLPTPSTVITVSSPFSSLVTCPWATPCQTELVCPPITTLAKHTRLPC